MRARRLKPVGCLLYQPIHGENLMKPQLEARGAAINAVAVAYTR